MSLVLTILGCSLISLGLLVLVISTIGLLRLPTFYSRAHAVAMAETLGLALIFAGALFLPQTDVPTAVRLVLVMGFSMLANPTAVHALAHAARQAGLPLWRPRDAKPPGPAEAVKRVARSEA